MDMIFSTIFSVEWLVAFGSIVLLDLIMSGDNAILIALTCKNLPKEQRFKAMFIGCFGAVFIRIVLTCFAATLLSIAYLQFIGGLALLYIAMKLLIDHGGSTVVEIKKTSTLLVAIKTILAADLIMSMDNILSLAGVANTVSGDKWILIFCGLLVSIPIVLCGAQFFLWLMNKFPIIIYFGAGILAWTSGKMMVTDPSIGYYFISGAPYIEGGFITIVLSIGWYFNKIHVKNLKTTKNMVSYK
ncbi:TerC family protein [Propionispira raffinosivorans]|uniref:TerC family protein n=1 Tax=Propionispira raffinosivorans TaxID=86959 RepID=UPI00035CF38E|nr:TerC family protein [Propionispira raffinosivorans]